MGLLEWQVGCNIFDLQPGCFAWLLHEALHGVLAASRLKWFCPRVRLHSSSTMESLHSLSPCQPLCCAVLQATMLQAVLLMALLV